MATEEFKQVTEQLFDNYVELKLEKMKEHNVNLTFKEYLEIYIDYIRYNNEVFEDDLDEYINDDGED